MNIQCRRSLVEEYPPNVLKQNTMKNRFLFQGIFTGSWKAPLHEIPKLKHSVSRIYFDFPD